MPKTQPTTHLKSEFKAAPDRPNAFNSVQVLATIEVNIKNKKIHIKLIIDSEKLGVDTRTQFL